jgi:hypothetical protein
VLEVLDKAVGIRGKVPSHSAARELVDLPESDGNVSLAAPRALAQRLAPGQSDQGLGIHRCGAGRPQFRRLSDRMAD